MGMEENFSVGVIGLGLIGGSLAKNFRRVFPQCRIVVYNRSEAPRLAAAADGTADVVTNRIDSAFDDCDYIFLCMPVEYNVACLKDLKHIMKPGCILSDVGSVKSDIHAAITAEGMQDCFIGGHPMAGSEKTGYDNASSYLLENAYYAITPTEATAPEDLARFEQLVRTLGAVPIILPCDEHDYSVAAISHVPHLIAAGLVNLVKKSDTPNETMKVLAAGGFKDITRIASSSPVMWEQICLENRENITKILDDYIAYMQNVRQKVADSDGAAVNRLFVESSAYRDSFSENKPGLLPKSYTVIVDIIDEAGAISTIATILASNGISIKNIGIVHNREYDEGVLRIEFYEEKSLEKAIALLEKYKYTVHR